MKKYKYIKNNNGITLIAVIVTIIILIILAGITIGLVLDDDGLFAKAKKSVEEQKIAELSEKLELIKGNILVNKLNTIIIVDEYLEELQNFNKVDFSIDEIIKVNEENAYVTLDEKYVFLIEYKEDNNLIITYQGKVENLKPIILSVQLKNTNNSIAVKIDAKRTDKYEYYIKDNLEGRYEYDGESTINEYTYKNLEENKKYYIKIEAINNNGKVESITETNTLPTYSVTLNKDSGISSVSGEGRYIAGQEVTITATVLEDYKWVNWTGNEEVLSQNYTFIMPENDLVFTANTISTLKKYSLKYKSYDWICPDGDDKKGTMTMQYVNISAENSKYLTSIETSGSQTGNVSASNLLTGIYTDVQNVGKSLTATKSGITEHNTNTMTENVTFNLSFPAETTDEYAVQFSIYGSYQESGGSTQAWSYWHGNSGSGCNVFTISKDQLGNISKIYVDNTEKTFSEDSDFTIYQSSVADKRKGLHTYSHTIKIVFK